MIFKNGIDIHIIIRFVNIISPYYNKININQGDMEVFFVNYDFLKDLSVDNLMQFDQKIASSHDILVQMKNIRHSCI